MDARKRMALILTVLLFGMGGHAAFAEAQYTARDKNGQIVKQGTTTENEEFSAFDGLEYEINGEHQVSDWQNTAYVFGNRTKIHINGDVINHKQGTSIEVTDQASAVINGNWCGDVRRFSAALKIFGDIEAEPNGEMGAVFATGENGNRIKYRTQTTITGNVQSTGIGVSASPVGHINITGNVKAGTNGG